MKHGFYLIGKTKALSREALKENVAAAFKNEKMVEDLREYDKSCDTPEKLFALALIDDFEIQSLKEDKAVSLITDDYPLTEFFLWRYYMWQ